MSESEPVIGYCVKCKQKREMKDTEEVAMPGKGGERRAMKGKCTVCGTGMYKILGKKKEEGSVESAG
jgi:hypothetical protein